MIVGKFRYVGSRREDAAEDTSLSNFARKVFGEVLGYEMFPLVVRSEFKNRGYSVAFPENLLVTVFENTIQYSWEAGEM